MPGGHIQLSFYGIQDQYLTGNPQITFFKTVYRRYTNFSMESIRVDFEGSNIDRSLNVDSSVELKCKIPRHGDLISNIYFVCTLPEIYTFNWWQVPKTQVWGNKPVAGSFQYYDSLGVLRGSNLLDTRTVLSKTQNNVAHSFHWIKNIGFNMIEKVDLCINDTIIDTNYGEWLSIWNEIHNPDKQLYNKLVGNMPELYKPMNGNQGGGGRQWYGNGMDIQWMSRMWQKKYPAIESYKLYVPLNFWFNRNPGLALPLIALQYSDVYLKFKLRKVRDLYTIIPEADVTERNKPAASRSTTENIGLYLSSNLEPNASAQLNTLDINAHLEVNYIFLSQDERTKFANMEHKYIIETTSRTVAKGYHDTANIELDINHPVKELIWVAKRNDIEELNDWNNYTNWIHEDITPYEWRKYEETYDYDIGLRENGDRFFPSMSDVLGLTVNTDSNTYLKNLRRDIITKARILFNGIERLEWKDAEYFKYVQRYQHYRDEVGIPTEKEGIYVYSFALNGQELQPSGACNTSNIKTINIQFEVNPPPRKLVRSLASSNDELIELMGDSQGNAVITFSGDVADSDTAPTIEGDYWYKYDFYIYSTNYNILHIVGGMAGLQYSN